MFRMSLIASAVSLIGAVPASAAIVIADFGGEIVSGTDVSGYFTGTPGTDLGSLGSPTVITGRFVYDTAAAPDGGGPGLYGGDGVTEWLDFEVTIVGQTYQFGSFAATAGNIQTGFVANDPDNLNLQLQRASDAAAESIGIDLGAEEFLTGTGLPLSFTYSSAFGGTGSLVIQTETITADAFFSITSASTQAPIPEPAAWMTMVLGFGLAGSLIRKARTGAGVKTA